MTPFNETAICPKCQSKDISSSYYKQDEGRWKSYHEIDREKREHIRRTCQRCNFKWNEAPLDSVHTPEKP